MIELYHLLDTMNISYLGKIATFLTKKALPAKKTGSPVPWKAGLSVFDSAPAGEKMLLYASHSAGG